MEVRTIRRPPAHGADGRVFVRKLWQLRQRWRLERVSIENRQVEHVVCARGGKHHTNRHSVDQHDESLPN